jgi:hypothetical protein
MKKFFSIVKTGAGAAALLLVMPSVVSANTIDGAVSTGTGTVHKISHSLAGTIKYLETSNYKWGAQSESAPRQTSEWAKNDIQAQNYKWSVAEGSANGTGRSNTFAGETSYSWGVRSFSDQAAYKWGFRSYSDQAAYKWGFRSFADQAAYKWGFRSFADQAAYKWGFR